ncbi:MAG: tRNA N6-adenosine threonylcarbamoyltransferase [Solirubrobacterales bacterium]|jgi:N6-L-threonylcarbamoyladenine synthase|nr:tRNA N6-adenosine threonylcarbamoyltransferase [Solirubrobacterales bacterium]
MRLLALETSCDDTCAAVVEGAAIRSSIVSSQAALHERYGGVVPEVASRHHLQLVNAAVEAALDDAGTSLDEIDAVAVTRGPGLIGALLVGLSSAKAIAASRRLPLIPVDHLHGHVAANFLQPDPLDPPFLCLIASGGHTLLAGVRSKQEPQRGPGREAEEPPFDVLGTTLDDAAGEALDKAARLLGLGYPGGPAVERAAAGGDPDSFELPVAMTRDPGLDLSFSGLKTALVYIARDLGDDELRERTADLAASFQQAVVAQLVAKVGRALDDGEWEAVALGGGVAANSLLRERVGELCESRGVRLKLVPPALCTDNAAMIAAAAQVSEAIAYPGYLDFDAFSTDDNSLRAA